MGNFLGRASDGAFPNFLPAQLLWDYDAALPGFLKGFSTRH
jgi:hypothetical protein